MEIFNRIIRFVFLINFGVRIVAPKREINIIGFFPTSEGSVGRGVIPAVDLALEMVNSNSSLLKDYQLKMYFNDSKCDMAVATKLLFDTLHNRRDNAMLFGDACFDVTGPMAQISKWWNMSQLSYADTNPVLSDRTKYTKLFRVVPSDSDFNPARLALLRHFMWRRVGTIFQDASKGSPRYGYAHNRLVSLLENSTIQVNSTENFKPGTDSSLPHPQAHNRFVSTMENSTFQVPSTDSFADDPAAAVQNLLDRDIRIILGNFAPNMAKRVFCEAFKKKMYGPKYQWIILGGFPKDWLEQEDRFISCTENQLKTAMHGFITTDILPLSSADHQTESQLTAKEYKALYDKSRGTEYSKFHGYAFDGIWVIAKALDKLLTQTTPMQTDDEEWEMIFRTPEMVDALDDTNFQGVTGSVKFQNGDRIGGIVIQQYQDGAFVKVGEFQKDGDLLTLSGKPKLIWRGDGPPRDGYLRKSEMQKVNTPIYAALCVLSGLGIVMALVFLLTNIYFRKHRYIKMSSPNMNNIIIVGCIMNYVSVFLLGTDGGLLPSNRFPLMCSARAWVLAIGFTLAFGAMFSKTWRVHAIFTNIKLNKKVIKDYKLFFIVCVLLLLDAVILVLWQAIDPLQRSVKSLAAEIVGDFEIIPLIEYCHSKHMTAWMATLYVYKGLLLVFGCFLAWETRQVSIPALNDSKYIGMSVYNVVIMCVCGAAVSFVIKDQPNAAFIIIGLFIIFCTTITLCLVFVPKVVELQRDPEGEDKRVRATLKKPSKRDKSCSSDLHEKVKMLSEENIRFKDILEEKNKEIRELLRELGEDVNSYDYSIKSPMHKNVLTLRQKGNPEMSPSKISRSSVGTEDDNASCYSDSSLTQLYIDSPEHHRHSSYLHSRNSNSVTETIELTDIGRKSTTGKLSPITDSREYIQPDCYDPYSGVYLGPSEPEVTVVENVNYRPPATEEHPIIQRYSGVSFLDECQTGNTGHLSEESDQEDSDQDMSNNISIHSGVDMVSDFGYYHKDNKSRTSPEEEGLLDELTTANEPCDNTQRKRKTDSKDGDETEADDDTLEEIECDVLEEEDLFKQQDFVEDEDNRNVTVIRTKLSPVEECAELLDDNVNNLVDSAINNNMELANTLLASSCESTFSTKDSDVDADIGVRDNGDETQNEVRNLVLEQSEKLVSLSDITVMFDDKAEIRNDSVECGRNDNADTLSKSFNSRKISVDETGDGGLEIFTETNTGVESHNSASVKDVNPESGDENKHIFDRNVDIVEKTENISGMSKDQKDDDSGHFGDNTDNFDDYTDIADDMPVNLYGEMPKDQTDNPGTYIDPVGDSEVVADDIGDNSVPEVHFYDTVEDERTKLLDDTALTDEETVDFLEGAHAPQEEAKEIFITDSLSGLSGTKGEKVGRVKEDTPLLRPLLSSIKHSKVAPKSKDRKVDLDKGSRTFMCDVVEYI